MKNIVTQRVNNEEEQDICRLVKSIVASYISNKLNIEDTDIDISDGIFICHLKRSEGTNSSFLVNMDFLNGTVGIRYYNGHWKRE